MISFSLAPFEKEDVSVFRVGPNMAQITVYLTAHNLGHDADETLFSDWMGYVADNIDAATGLDITVDRHAFSGRNAGGPDDTIEGATEEQRALIRLALESLWELGCAENFGKI